MLAHAALVRPAPDSFGPAELRALAASVASRAVASPRSWARATSTLGSIRPSNSPPRWRRRSSFGPSTRLPAPPTLSPPLAATTPTVLPHPPSPHPPLAILGAGDYVRIEVAPALGGADLDRVVLCDREPQIAALASAELGFATALTDAAAAIDSLERRGLVIVATAHDSHAELAARALDGGHRVICEKPAVVNAADLDRLTAAAAAAPGELEVGFNRRYNPLVERARECIAGESGPATIVASIREVDITPDHWYLWPNQGTRVAGNLCHWIDLALHLLGPGPEPVAVSVSPRVSLEPTGVDAERTFSISFDDGSSLSLVPTGRGDSTRGVQEQIEVRRGQLTLRLDDLWKLQALRAGWPMHRRTLWRDKGNARMYASALRRFEQDNPPPTRSATCAASARPRSLPRSCSTASSRVERSPSWSSAPVSG